MREVQHCHRCRCAYMKKKKSHNRGIFTLPSFTASCKKKMLVFLPKLMLFVVVAPSIDMDVVSNLG